MSKFKPTFDNLFSPADQKRALTLVAGPCQIESLEHCLFLGEKILEVTNQLPINLIFKASFDKANRTSLKGARGIGLDRGLEILGAVREKLNIPVVTDIHLPEQAQITSQAVDMLQIPAFMCRQTDLLIAAGETGLPIKVKKGQFLHPSDMKFVAEKVCSTGNKQVILCERGTSFGYRDLVVDMRSLIMMRQLGFPVVFDATHSVQQLGSEHGHSLGSRDYIAPLARAATAVGVDGLFIEVHENPSSAPSDGASMLELSNLAPLLKSLCALHIVE